MDPQPEEMDTPQATKPHHGPIIPRAALVLTVTMSLLMGAIGGAGSVYVLTNTSSSRLLGSNVLSVPVKQHITLEETSKFIDVAKSANPSVVSITVSRSVSNLFGQTVQQKGGGTGFVISNDGLIATNKHVASDTNGKYTVVMSDGTTHDATVKAIDPFFDFAVVKIDAKNLKPLDFGDSDQLQVGQWVAAIGNALAQFNNTYTTGVISAKERSITAGDSTGSDSESLEGLLQTDAAINQGNSGGPLLNLAGQVVGVNTAVASDAQGIGFSIPINVLKPAIDSVIKSGHIIRPTLGVRYVPVTKQVADQLKLSKDHGAYVQSNNGTPGIVPGSPAEKAGLKENDLITQIDGQDIDDTHSLSRLVQQHQVGQKIKVTYTRDNKEQSVDVVLEEYKQ